MQLIPIGLFILAYLIVFAYEETGAREAVLAHAGQRGEKNRVKRFNAYFGELMQTPMKLGWFLAIVVIAVAAVTMLLVSAFYMYRTGNSTTTSARELAFRNFLENTLIARPRTKEMIVGWPMLMLFIWSLRRRMKFLPMIFGTGMTIGLVSVVNTFLHIRTPFLLSLLRTGWGILFGLLIGTAEVIVAELIFPLVRGIGVVAITASTTSATSPSCARSSRRCAGTFPTARSQCSRTTPLPRAKSTALRRWTACRRWRFCAR